MDELSKLKDFDTFKNINVFIESRRDLYEDDYDLGLFVSYERKETDSEFNKRKRDSITKTKRKQTIEDKEKKLYEKLKKKYDGSP